MLSLDPSIRAFTKDSPLKSSQKPWIMASQIFENICKYFLLSLVAIYRVLGTTHLGGACRFTPSCSEYALDVLRQQNAFTAFSLIVRRILRCRPGGDYGFDPAPTSQKHSQCHSHGECHARSK
ncbi:MAG: membrane protein insertion efficiency factor YidD [Proteobacteria bacterium]|nr:MAG: membrane protein insertion efficiency factor YidD [Pseudomonadota bacterium]